MSNAYAVASRLARANSSLRISTSSTLPALQAWRGYATDSTPPARHTFGLRKPSEAGPSELRSRPARAPVARRPVESPVLEASAAASSSTPAPGPATAEPAKPRTNGDIDSIDAWRKAGLPLPVIERLLELYPECVAPTPAQLAFLLAINKGDVDIYLKDYMGRGKTFALVLAALAIVSGSGPVQRGRVVMVLPTPHLAKQVEDLLRGLGPDVSVTTATSDGEVVNLNACIVLGTPKALLAVGQKKRNMTLGDRIRGVTHVFVDEVDTQIGSLPTAHATPKQRERHPSRLHTPPVANVLNSLFGITVQWDGFIDFSARKDITSVFSSATLDNNVRRHIYGKGWVRTKGENEYKRVVDLDFSAAATPRQVELRQTMGQIAARAGAVSAEPFQRKPRHYAFTVAPEGKILELDLQRVDTGGYTPDLLNDLGQPIDLDTLPLRQRYRAGRETAAKRPGLPVTLLEGLAYLHASVPPPAGTYSLAVLPDGASIHKASKELEELGLTVVSLVPEVIEGGVAPPAPDAPHIMLVTTRAAVPGLHLPHLHSIYLLNGLDVSKLSKSAKEFGGREHQSLVYSIITGRLGRFATEVYDTPQRVVSIVQDDSYEEWALRHMFGEMHGKWQFALSQWPGELS